MLHLYQSNRLEDLAALLGKVHQLRPLSQPLASEEIIVQSQGMRRFLNQFLAQEYGIAANLNFSLPAGFNWQLMRRVLPDIPALNPFHPEVMRWRLLDLFSDGINAPELNLAQDALSDYLASGNDAPYQLAGQLSDIFDQYLVYRADWIEAWQQGKLLGLGEAEAWQAQLWRFLDDGSQTAPHRADMWQQLLQKLSADVLPERISVFGIATLAPMYLQLLQAVAQHTEVHIFALNPSEHFWGNVIEPTQILAKRVDSDLSQSGHPLLASLGKQGRDFFDALAESGAALELPVYAENALSDGILHQIQFGIQSLILPEQTETVSLDNSIRIVSAHSPLRELQILKDHLLQLLSDNPDWQAHDIAVLTPDIAPYFPYIEAVFGTGSHQGQALPYSVSDVKLSNHQPLLHALEQILVLFDSRFEVDKVLPLLDSEPVLRRFGLTREDLPLLHDTIAALNIHWGRDKTMRGEDDLYTWQQGLDRLILGWLQPENSSMWQHLAAWHSNPNHTATLARFSQFINTLIHHHRQWQSNATIHDWANRVRDLQNSLTVPAEDDQTALQQLEQALTRWQQEAELAQFQGKLSQQTVIRHISRFLTSQSEAGFLRGGITFCSMVPMRSLPFKAVCLLGLNDGAFPRNTHASAFDLISHHPKRGDRARRDDDRYLFLEFLISAREHLYLSYIGKNIRTNEELAPSALLDELIDVIASMTGETPDTLHEKLVEQHPLQAFSPQYFQHNSPFNSTRSDYAQALNSPIITPVSFLDEMPSETTEMPSEITQNQFLNFWRNPLKYWLRQRLNWQAPYQDEAWDSTEPFTPKHDAENANAYIQARQAHQDFADTARELTARSMLPPAHLGEEWQQRYAIFAKSLDSELLHSPKLPARPFTFSDGIITLNGSLQHLHQHGQIFLLNDKPSFPKQTDLLLQHLIYNATTPDTAPNRHSHWLASNSQTLNAIPQQTAQALLKTWLHYFQIGQTYPLPYLPKTSWHTAQAWLKGKTEEEALQKAQEEAFKHYEGNKKSKGQKYYLEVAQFDENSDSMMIDSPLFWNVIIDALIPTLRACGLAEEK